MQTGFALRVLFFLFLTGSKTIAQPTNYGFELGFFLSGIDLKSSVGETAGGYGARLAYRLSKNLILEGEFSYFPENPSGNYGQTMAFAGLRAGMNNKRFGAFLKVRPGIIYYGGSFFKAYNGNGLSNITFDVGVVVQYSPSAIIFLRLDIGDTIIPFGDAIIKGPLETRQPGTTHNRQSSIGIGVRF